MKENRQSRLPAEIKEISGNYVFKLFRKFSGTTFQRYVETVRMEHAQTRLSVSASEYRRQAA